MPRSRFGPVLQVTSFVLLSLVPACGSARPAETAVPTIASAEPAQAPRDDGRGIVIRQIAPAPTLDATTPGRSAKSEGAAPSTFPRDDLRTALRASYRGVRGCRTDSGPTEIDGTVRFEPSGGVSAIDLGPGAVAACVKERLADVSLMPFEGVPTDVKIHVIF